MGPSTVPPAVTIKKPHNAPEFAVGAFDVPGDGYYDGHEFAHGNMGENDTTAFDPLCFLHHCFVDYMFWK